MRTPDALRHVSQVLAGDARREDVERHAAEIRVFLDMLQAVRMSRLARASCFPWDLMLALGDTLAWARVHLDEMELWLKRNPE